MNRWQKGKSKTIIVWRDSVAAGDDAFAPHEKKVKNEVITCIKQGKPLPDKFGGSGK